MQDIRERKLMLNRRSALLGALGAAAWLAGCGGGDDDTAEDAVDPQVQRFWQRYFSAKSSRDADGLSAQFAAENVVYEDNTLRRRMAGSNAFIRSQWQGLFAYIPPGPRSILNSAVGTMRGAAVELTNEAGLFASVPIDGLSIVDLHEGKIARITDYWDSSSGRVGRTECRIRAQSCVAVRRHGQPSGRRERNNESVGCRG
jgi:ketosteroid isomerase-like protein